MKKIYFFSCIGLLLTSCTFSNDGEVEVHPMVWIFIIAVIITFILMIIHGTRTEKKTNLKLKEESINPADLIEVGSYVGGHPQIDDQQNGALIYLKDGKFQIRSRNSYVEYPTMVGEIDINFIKNILVEDSSTIDKKVTLGRVLLVGVFALAWKKKEKNELAFISIEWNDGKFDHSTLFSFEGKEAMHKANIARNKLISKCYGN